MPIYEYSCPACAHVFEEWVRSSEGTETANCPDCTAVATRIMSNTTFMLKGGGWYVTEYGNRAQDGNGQDSKAADAPADSAAPAAATNEKTTAATSGSSASAPATPAANTPPATTTSATATSKPAKVEAPAAKK